MNKSLGLNGQPGGTDYAHLITTGTPGFSDLPTALLIYSHSTYHKKGNISIRNLEGKSVLSLALDHQNCER